MQTLNIIEVLKHNLQQSLDAFVLHSTSERLFKVILYSYLILMKMNERITDS